MSSRRHVGERTGVEIWTGDIAGSDLVRDYLSGEPGLATFYAGHPFDPDAFRRKADAVHARLSPEARARIAAAMKATRPGAEQKMRRVLNGEGLAVTTGQQAGLFGGPLYTVYKILTAIRLSGRLEELLAQPVVPVFWIAADDHDWAEVNHTFVIDTANELRRIELPATDQPPVPMSHRGLGPDVTGAIDALAAAMPSTEFAESAMGVVRSCYESDATMASAFGELLRKLFAEFDLILLDPSHPSLKLASVPLLVHDLERTARGNGLLMQQATRLTDAGYHVQVTIAPEAANVFLNDEAGRDRLTRDDGAWIALEQRAARADQCRADTFFAQCAAPPGRRERADPDGCLRWRPRGNRLLRSDRLPVPRARSGAAPGRTSAECAHCRRQGAQGSGQIRSRSRRRHAAVP
jgi:bacillithiol biosynthesis cysteine-adding enzyme BshC